MISFFMKFFLGATVMALGGVAQKTYKIARGWKFFQVQEIHSDGYNSTSSWDKAMKFSEIVWQHLVHAHNKFGADWVWLKKVINKCVKKLKEILAGKILQLL